MRKYLLLLLALITLACNKRGDEPTAEKAYAMLECVAEQNALGNKLAALALADSALALNPADTTRCWLMSEKAVTLVDMGRMADAVGVAQGAYALARKLHDVEAMLKANPHVLENTVQVKVKAFGDSSIDIWIRAQVNTPQLADFNAVRNDLNLSLMDVMEKNGCSFAFPSTSIYVEQTAPAAQK